MSLQDNTEDFREDAARFQRAMRFQRFTPEEIDEMIRAQRRNARLWYVVALLVAALATAGYWIATH